MSTSELSKEKLEELKSVITRRERGGANVNLSKFFRTTSGKNLLKREKARAEALKSA